MTHDQPTSDLVAIIATVWQQQTKQDLHLRTVERIFYKFIQEGFCADDLRCVLVWVKWKNTQSERKRQINLRLILDHDAELPFAKFACDLGEAKAWERNRRPAPTPKQQVVQQFSPVLVEQTTGGTATTPAQIKFIQAIKGVK